MKILPFSQWTKRIIRNYLTVICGLALLICIVGLVVSLILNRGINNLMAVTILVAALFAFDQGWHYGRKSVMPPESKGLPMYGGKPEVRTLDFEVDADKKATFKSKRGEEITG